MIGTLLKVATSMVPGIGGIVSTVLPAVIGNKQQRDESQASQQMQTISNAHDENTARLRSYSNEFTSTNPNRNVFDSLVDGINRLVRPTFVYGIITLIILSFTDEKNFNSAMVSLSNMPQWLQITIGTIIAFYFGTRSVFKGMQANKVERRKDAAQNVMLNQPAINSRNSHNSNNSNNVVDDDVDAVKRASASRGWRNMKDR